VKFGIGSSM